MEEIQKWVVTEPFIDIPGTLLEGPYFDDARNELRFVDLWEQKLYFLDLAKGPESLVTLETPASVGVTANIENGGEPCKDKLIAAAKLGFALLDRTSGELTWIYRVWDDEKDPGQSYRMRFNDGAVDSHGRFWAGALNDPKVVTKFTNEGALFRLDPDLKLHRMVEHMTIPNGIGWNAADDTMYLTDSPTSTIYAFDFDAPTGQITNRREHVHLDGLIPDGFAIDVEGCIWSAIYGGGKVLRIAPDGQVIGEICLPTKNITCPVFVGTELFITTAKDDGRAPDVRFPQSVRYGGRLFRVDVGVRGQAKNKFRFQE